MRHCLFCRVRDHRFSPTMVVGAMSAAATTGALVAIGHRMGHAGAPFAAVASVLHRAPPSGRAGAAVLVIGGLVVHAIAIVVWGALCVRIADRTRSKAVAALVIALANFLVSSFAASWTGRGLASELTLGDRVIYAIVLTASLIVGMRYAFLHPRETATS